MFVYRLDDYLGMSPVIGVIRVIAVVVLIAAIVAGFV